MLVEQGREIVLLKKEHEERDEERRQLEESNERLGRKVVEKDFLISKLQGRLEKKNEQIHELQIEKEAWCSHRQAELDKSDSIAEAALWLNGFLGVAQRAADQYLYNIRQRCEGRGGSGIPEPEEVRGDGG